MAVTLLHLLATLLVMGRMLVLLVGLYAPASGQKLLAQGGLYEPAQNGVEDSGRLHASHVSQRRSAGREGIFYKIKINTGWFMIYIITLSIVKSEKQHTFQSFFIESLIA